MLKRTCAKRDSCISGSITPRSASFFAVMFSAAFMNAYLRLRSETPTPRFMYQLRTWGTLRVVTFEPERKPLTLLAPRKTLGGFLFLLGWRGCSRLLSQQLE